MTVLHINLYQISVVHRDRPLHIIIRVTPHGDSQITTTQGPLADGPLHPPAILAALPGGVPFLEEE